MVTLDLFHQNHTEIELPVASRLAHPPADRLFGVSEEVEFFCADSSLVSLDRFPNVQGYFAYSPTALQLTSMPSDRCNQSAKVSHERRSEETSKNPCANKSFFRITQYSPVPLGLSQHI